VLLPYLPTARNEPARAFADSVAAEFASPANEGKVYRIPADKASTIKHRAGHDPVEVIEARLADEKKSAGSKVETDPALSSRSLRFERLATVLSTGKGVSDELRRRRQGPRALQGSAVLPETPTQSQMSQIWESLLGVRGIGIDDDYFALGGTSLLSVALFAEIRRAFDVNLRLTCILEAPTIRTLSRAVDVHGHGEEQRGLICLRAGHVRNVFLVHDGLGETLLYLNLAQRMPPGVSVYGIEPKRLPGIPLAHASIEKMAEYYVQLIRQVQASGPYEIGGMCAGGVIAYAMAVHLVQQGERVRNVVILDGATPQAAKRKGRLATARISRLLSVIASPGSSRSSARKYAGIFSTLLRKAWSGGGYELKMALQRISTKLRFQVFLRTVSRQSAWPTWIPPLSVMQIYNELEARYSPPALHEVPVVLVRASIGDAEDTPYREIYEEEDFGWRRVAVKLDLIDVEGGHASMLQASHVSSLTSALAGRIG
jgi:thioesterase domain-containing protein